MPVTKFIEAVMFGLAALLISAAGQSAHSQLDLHPDWTDHDPIMWRLPLDAGEAAALYIVDGELLVQYSDLRTLIISRDGVVEDEISNPYTLRPQPRINAPDFLDANGRVYSLRRLNPSQDVLDYPPTDYELRVMDIRGAVQERYEVKAELGPLGMLAEGDGLVLLVDGETYNPKGDAGTSMLVAFQYGRRIWQRDLPQYGAYGAVVLNDGTTIYSDMHDLYGIGPDGEELWKRTDETHEGADIVPLDRRSCLVTFGSPTYTVYRFDVSGQVWSLRGLDNFLLLPDYPRNFGELPNGSVLIADSVWSMVLVDSQGRRLWSRRVNLIAENYAVGANSDIYFVDWEAGLVALDGNGHYLWAEPRLKGQGLIYRVDEEGLLYAIHGNELYCIDTNAYTPRQPPEEDPSLTYYTDDQS